MTLQLQACLLTVLIAAGSDATGLRGAQTVGSGGAGASRDPAAGMRKVDQGYTDASPLGTSNRDVPLDLRVPDGFRDVYQLPASAGRYAGWYARISGGGGIVAVYQQGRYTAVNGGLRADVPADTTFFIGGLPRDRFAPISPIEGEGALGAGLSRAISTRLETRIEVAAGGEDANSAAEQEAGSTHTSRTPPPEELAQRAREREAVLIDSVSRLFSDEAHRAERVAALVRGSGPRR